MNKKIKIILLTLLIAFITFTVVNSNKEKEIQTSNGKEIGIQRRLLIEIENVLLESVLPTYENINLYDVKSSTFTYEEGNINWAQGTMQQYLFSQAYMSEDGFYMIDDYYCVALGSYFGEVGSKFKITLSNGYVFNAIKMDRKADIHMSNGFTHLSDGSILEFVISANTVKNYYSHLSTNGYAVNGNISNIDRFNGYIVSIEREK